MSIAGFVFNMNHTLANRVLRMTLRGAGNTLREFLEWLGRPATALFDGDSLVIGVAMVVLFVILVFRGC